jgi:cytochrome c5
MRKRLLVAIAVGATAVVSGAAGADSYTYESTVKKIFAERCAACHINGAPSMSEFQNNKEAWTKKFKGPSLADYKSVMVMVNGSDAGALMRISARTPTTARSGWRRSRIGSAAGASSGATSSPRPS